MIRSVSILIPTYNQPCLPLVRTLAAQAADIQGLEWEILVGDDGSTDTEALNANRPISEIEHCKYIIRAHNAGRSAIRNYLSSAANGDWLLFVDSDVTIERADFLKTYMDFQGDESVVYGGLHAGGEAKTWHGNLRYRYEKAYERHHPAHVRQQRPYDSFRTTNFIIKREVMTDHPFDGNIKTYGYEDVLFGRSLHDHHIKIFHIDNPVTYETYEDNTTFLRKTDEALCTLCTLREQLATYSTLLRFTRQIEKLGMYWLLTDFYRLFKHLLRRNLQGIHPSLLLFQVYKVGRLCELERTL